MRGYLEELTVNRLTNTQRLSLKIVAGDATALFDEYGTGRELEISLSIPRKKRSLDANAYCWALIGKLAEKIDGKPKQIYRELIRDLGGNYETLQIKTAAIDAFERAWTKGHDGRFIEMISWDEYEGLACIAAYYGSSDYDTKTMSRLIDRVIVECREQGIETMTPKEKYELMKDWERRYGRMA